MKRFLSILIAAWCLSSVASAQAPGDPISWLGRISNAAHKLNYTGSFTYQSGKNIETSRIAHFVDANGDEHERLRRLMAAPGRWSATRRRCSAFFLTRSC